MFAIEFKGKIKQGLIEIPEEYQEQLRREAGNEVVRIIVLTGESADPVTNSTSGDLIERLLANPMHIIGFTTLSRDEVYERR